MSDTTHAPDLADEVRAALGRGWQLTTMIGKRPHRMGWQTEATLPLAELLRHVEGGGNIGLRCGAESGVVVVDFDHADTLPEDAPHTPTVRTGNGWHLYFLHREGLRNRTRLSLGAHTIDVRSKGGAAVLPGSVHPDTGTIYEWAVHPEDAALAEIPEGWLPILEGMPPPRPPMPLSMGVPSRGYGAAALAGEVEAVRHAPEGTRNATLNSAAYKLAGLIPAGHLEESEVVQALSAAARDAGLPPLEIVQTLASAIPAGRDMPRDVQPCAYATPYRNGNTETEAPRAWPTPEPLPTVAPVPPFDVVLLPEPLQAWIANVAEREPYPVEFLAVGAWCAASALLGRRCAVAPLGLDSDHVVVPNLWGLAVGRPSAAKTPSLSAALAPLHRLEAEAALVNAHKRAEHAKAEIVHDELLKAARKKIRTADAAHDLPEEPEPPRLTRYLVNDSSVEALGEILRDNPEGVLLFRDELTGLLAQLNKEYMAGARQFFLEAWGGTGAYTFDRVSRGSTRIEGLCISILGGMQPQPLAKMIREAGTEGGDGLLARFQLAVFPDPHPKMIGCADTQRNVEAERIAHAAMVSLAHLDPDAIGATLHERHAIPVIPFDDEAQALYRLWVEDYLRPTCRAKNAPALLEGALSKYRALVPALALLDHLLGGGGGPVPRASLDKAIATAAWLEAHLRRILSGAGGEVESARELLRHLRAGDLGESFTARDVYRPGWSGLGREAAGLALGLLEDAGYVRRETAQGGPSAGRPTTRWQAHPEITRHG